MLSKAPEKLLRYVRFLLLAGWFFILFLCVVDIGQVQLTQPNDPAAINGLVGKTIELREEVFVARPYNPATRLFWGLGVPIVVLILLFAGHDTWRRLCPLSAVSQIPRWLGYQRQRKDGNNQTIALVRPTSFIARYAILLQFTLFAIGVWLRLTVLSANPLALFFFTLALFCVAFLTGLLYGGKTWCHYLCPMNAVQLALSGPRGLNAANPSSTLSQSMCRKPTEKGDISSCVGCNSPCPDVDIERNYWEALPTPARRITVYGYLGVVVAFIHGLFAATGNNRYGAAVWYDSDWLAVGYAPFGELLPIPKILGAAILFLSWIMVCIAGGFLLEKLLSWPTPKPQENTPSNRNARIEVARHHSMTISTTAALFLLIHKVAIPGLGWLPNILVTALSLATTAAIAVWAYRSWNRTHQQYQRESLAESLRRKLGNMLHSWNNILSGRDLDSLSPDELHVIAELAPNLTNANKLEFYRAMLADTLEQGTAESFEGRKLLAQLRTTCNVSDDEHHAIVEELKGDFEVNDTLFVSASLRSSSFRTNLERIIYEGVAQHKKITDVLKEHTSEIAKLRSDYSISQEEEDAIILDITKEDGAIPKTLRALISQISKLRHMQLTLQESWAESALAYYLESQSVSILRECFSLIEALSPSEKHTQNIIQELASTHPALIKRYGHELATAFQLPENFSSDLTQFATSIISSELESASTLESTLKSLSNSENSIISCIASRAAELNGFEWGTRLLKTRLSEAGLNSLAGEKSDSNAPPTQRYVIHIKGHNLPSLNFRTQVIAGRSKSNDWVIDQPQASRKHFSLTPKTDGYYCEDLQSSNGTIVNGKTLREGSIKLPETGSIQVAHDATPFEFSIKTTSNESIEHPIDRIAVLLNNPIWQNIPDQALAKLFLLATPITITKDCEHYIQSEAAHIWVVLKGCVKMVAPSSSITLNTLQHIETDQHFFTPTSIVLPPSKVSDDHALLLCWDKTLFNTYVEPHNLFFAEFYKQGQQLLLSQLLT